MKNSINAHRSFSGKEEAPLHLLVEREKKLHQLHVELPVRIKLLNNGSLIQITYNNIVLLGAVCRQLIHQIGSRAWGYSLDYQKISKNWSEKFSSNCIALEQELESVFDRFDLTIRYEKDRIGNNKIYGIVSPNFVNVNQIDFREQFLSKIKKSTYLTPISNGMKFDRYNRVIETFDFNNPDYQTSYSYGLVYAKNNGYESYKVNWERTILICTNGLTAIESNESIWKHTKDIDLHDFITQTVQVGIINQKHIEERIELSQNSLLHRSTFDELMRRLSLSNASKNRIQSRLAIESNAVGNNQWALSQSLTWLGTHEKAIPIRNQEQLTRLGTDILESSLEHVLEQPPQIMRDQSYGLVMPK
ncbi:hypothetical protein [Candidatus Symbiobacter mobilis]|nr:hypothetical protein [Candidatus Symbiobacter mobilis]